MNDLIAINPQRLGEIVCGKMGIEEAEELLNEILATAQPVSGEAPKGWQLVPKEPTDKMMEAGRIGYSDLSYKAMLKAAPRYCDHEFVNYVGGRPKGGMDEGLRCRKCTKPPQPAADTEQPSETLPSGATIRCRKCGEQTEIGFNYAQPVKYCCNQSPCPHPGKGPCDRPASEAEQIPLEDGLWGKAGAIAELRAEQEQPITAQEAMKMVDHVDKYLSGDDEHDVAVCDMAVSTLRRYIEQTSEGRELALATITNYQGPDKETLQGLAEDCFVRRQELRNSKGE